MRSADRARSATVAVVLGALLLAAGQGASAQSVVSVGGPPVTGVGQGGDGGGATVVATTAPSVSIVPVRAGEGPAPATSTVPSSTTTPSAGPGAGSTMPGTTTTTLAPAMGAASVGELRAAIASALASAGAKRAGALVVVDGVGVVFDQGADMELMPASTQKLYIAGTSLLRLGPDRRFTTRLRSDGTVSGGVLRGDLVLEAGGDPSLGMADLRNLAADLSRTGIRSVTGRLVLDDGRFEAFRAVDGWKSSFVPGEVGLVSAFMVDGNRRYDLARSGGDVGLANLERLRSALGARSVKVSGRSRRGTASSTATVLASHSSAPLSDLVGTMLKRSDNTYAEVLLKQVGEGSASRGVRTIAEQFDRFSLRNPVQVDGSGLSYLNRSTPRQLVEWLQRADATAVSSVLRAALPVACGDGTMRSRLCGTAAAGAVRAKTGALDYVAALAGFGTTAGGHTVTFAFLVNDAPSASRGRAAIDAAVAAIAASAV